MIRKLFPVIVKEMIELRRDKLTLFIIIFIPSLLLFIYGYAISLDVKDIKLAVCDYDQSNYSMELVNSVLASGYFTLVQSVQDDKAIDVLMQRGVVRVGIVIYPSFSRDLKANRQTSIQIVVDGSNAQATQSALAYLYGVVTLYQQKLLKDYSMEHGLNIPGIIVEQRIWYNPLLESANSLIPGLIAFVLMIVAVIATTLSIVREKETGTIEQMVVTPLSAWHVVLGKIIPYFFLSIFASTLMIVLACTILHIPFKGSVMLLGLALILYLLGSLGLGLLVSAISESQQTAFSIAVFITMLPTMILSNFVFPISSMPLVIQWVTVIIPAKYFIEVARGIMLKGTGFYPLWHNYFALLLFAGIALGAGIVKINKKGLGSMSSRKGQA
ncbi:MAG: hypothetical protein A2Y62_09620 [Candidatus Fischerbacteria bacterium RBG_13_37_8]|uniref:Transport permease protein n=1 Tax=Candidatus Fischerbacteria bacterium RBG_13_37_8 TaxID=1817863 RepID=A0A1F5V5P5_9BACT|nr:MAG: hypothetical protein A2Y62_09620 [Candidatus Fischerbacteria bacterium RBG_13_37_8]